MATVYSTAWLEVSDPSFSHQDFLSYYPSHKTAAPAAAAVAAAESQ